MNVFIIKESFHIESSAPFSLKTKFEAHLYNKTHPHPLQSCFPYAASLFSKALTTVWQARELLSHVFIFLSASFDGRNCACLVYCCILNTQNSPWHIVVAQYLLNKWKILNAITLFRNLCLRGCWHRKYEHRTSLPAFSFHLFSPSAEQILGGICLWYFVVVVVIVHF